MIGLGLEASVSKTTQTTTDEGGQIPCPQGNWECALAVVPKVLQVSGTETIPNCNGAPATVNDYTALIPQIDSANSTIALASAHRCDSSVILT